jgi:hypothetical protein
MTKTINGSRIARMLKNNFVFISGVVLGNYKGGNVVAKPPCFLDPIVFSNKYVIYMALQEFNVVGTIKYVVKWYYLYG